MSLIYGTKQIGDWTVPDERPKSYHELIFKLVPDMAPLFNLSSKLGEEPVTDFEYAVFNEGLVVNYLTTTGAHDNAVTTINLAGTTPAKAVRAGMALRNRRTDEILRVSTAPATPFALVVVDTRGSWGGGAAAMIDGDVLDIMSPPGLESDVAPAAISDTPSVDWNYLQDMEESCELSDWADSIEIRPRQEKQYAREKRRAMERFQIAWEKTLYYGKKVSTTVSGKKSYMTGGLNYWISQLFDDSSIGTSIDRVLDIMAQLRSYGQGSMTKWGIAGIGAITRLSNLVRKSTTSNVEMSAPLDRRGTWGITIRELQGPALNLQLIHSGVMSLVATNRVWILDPKYLKLARLVGKIGPVHFDDDIKKDDGYKGRKGRWRAVMGLQLGQATVHAKWDVGDPLPS